MPRGRSTPAAGASTDVSTVTRQKEPVSDVAAAIAPIKAGAISPEAYTIAATPAMDWLGTGPIRAAAAKVSGTTTEMPTPTSANPMTATHGAGAKTITAPPAVATIPPPRTVRVAPSLLITALPANLETAMVQANAV